MPIQPPDDTSILIDFPPPTEEVPGSRRLRGLPDDLAQRSAEAIDKTFSTIKAMAERAVTSIDELTNHPKQVEIEFGVKLDAEAGALIASTSVEASISVKLVWEREKAVS
jgi:Trypsin-co-occurring domain 1